MEKILLWVGRLGGIVGVVMCAIAILARVRNFYYVSGFQAGTVFLAGIAAMLLGCLAYVAAVAERRRL